MMATRADLERARYHGWTPTPEELAADAQYAAQWRRDNPEKADRARRKSNARKAASLAVAKEHPEEFAAAIRVEEEKAGL